METVRVVAYYTRNLGNFENARIGYEIEADVPAGEILDDTKARLQEKVDGWVVDRINEIDADAEARK